MIVVLTAEAEADLERIGDWIARDNPSRAVSFIRDIRTSCLQLGKTPLAFPVIPRFQAAGIRRRVHGDYLILYRVTTRVEIIHVVHGAMDYNRLILPEG